MAFALVPGHPPLAGHVRSLFTSAVRWRSRSWGVFGTSRRAVVPLLPEGMDPRGRHHCGPQQFIGKTPEQIVERFKDPATFPWYRVPEALRRRRFEELWQLAHRCGYKSALQAVQTITDAPGPQQANAAEGVKQRMGRSRLRALRSGVPAAPAYGKGPRSTLDD
ncbi:unnamed protein product [Effrenium voratum]|uniref:Uncharacterized protein n=1 Tax=Effrenium voratum TaxID=2562239 RepID=A0AA36N4A7_9DINO|nr:unnamed protein product [Effrenium voratum]CAJ1388998.1 unnamed protein product [Effrenium voratum]